MAIKLDPLQRKKFRADGRVKLHPEQLKQLGFSGTSKRYWIGGGKTISESKARTLREGVTKAKRTQALASGAARYHTPQAKASAAYARRAAVIRHQIPNIAPRDARLIDLKNQIGYNQLTQKQKDEIRALFYRYPVEDVRAALGYVAERKAA